MARVCHTRLSHCLSLSLCLSLGTFAAPSLTVYCMSVNTTASVLAGERKDLDLQVVHPEVEELDPGVGGQEEKRACDDEHHQRSGE